MQTAVRQWPTHLQGTTVPAASWFLLAAGGDARGAVRKICLWELPMNPSPSRSPTDPMWLHTSGLAIAQYSVPSALERGQLLCQAAGFTLRDVLSRSCSAHAAWPGALLPATEGDRRPATRVCRARQTRLAGRCHPGCGRNQRHTLSDRGRGQDGWLRP